MISLDKKIIKDETLDFNQFETIVKSMAENGKLNGLYIFKCHIINIPQGFTLFVNEIEIKPWYIFWRKAKGKTKMFGMEVINTGVDNNIFEYQKVSPEKIDY